MLTLTAPDANSPNRSSASLFDRRTFTLPAARRDRLTGVVMRYVDPARPLRVLDVGCGTGAQILDLARFLPAARFTGIDISAASIRAANEARMRSHLATRAAFVCGDYLNFHDSPFDLIIADSVLHAISTTTDALFGKLATELTDDGLLVYTMPDHGLYNRGLAHFRRVLRATRHPLAERALLTVSKLTYGRRYSVDMLRERIPYMYLVPARYDSPALHRVLEQSFGLTLIEHAPVPHASVAQPRHVLAVFRKRRGDRSAQTSASTASITRS